MEIKPTLKPGDVFYSPGCSYRYEVVGAVCQLYDRENLPYPSCSLSWKGKQPSWRRIGRRFINDIASANREVYLVKLLGAREEYAYQHWVFTYWGMSIEFRKWWHGK